MIKIGIGCCFLIVTYNTIYRYSPVKMFQNPFTSNEYVINKQVCSGLTLQAKTNKA
jgi:hypothetical protein